MWPRPEWERVLVEGVRESGSQVAYILREVCPFPPVLKRRAFFDSITDIRQWVIQTLYPERNPPLLRSGQPDDSLRALLDNPVLLDGIKRSPADWFISQYWRWFENVYRVQCGSATRSGVLGEMAHVMGLRLAGTVDQNFEALRNQARRQRALYVFEDLPEEFQELAELGGKASVIVLAQESVPEPVTLARLKETFFAPNPDEAFCLRMLGRFISSEQEPDNWDDMKSIGFRARLFFQQEMRLAEAHELLVWLAIQAQRNGDRRALEQVQWEENWILDSWDLPPVERTELVRTQPSQLWLYSS
jgi:hypothetical protein